MQQIAPAVFSIVELEPRRALHDLLYEQRDDAKDCSVSLRRTTKREPFTRQLPSRVTVWAAALVRLRRSAGPRCPLNCHFIRHNHLAVGINAGVSSREAVLTTRMKAKRKGKAKRKKMLVSKVAARKKATAVRKTKAIRKKAPKRAPARRVSSKKAKPAAKVAVEAAPASASAEPEAVRPMPGFAAQPTPLAEPGERIGVVTHYYSHLSVAIMRLESGGTLRVGDVIHIRGHTTDFSQKVESLEVNQAPVTEVRPERGVRPKGG